MTRSLRPSFATALDLALMILGLGCASSEAAVPAAEPTACIVREAVELSPVRAGMLGGHTSFQVALPPEAWDDELVMTDAIVTAREGDVVLAPTVMVAGVAVDPDMDLRDFVRAHVLELELEVEADEPAARRFDLEICLGTR